MTSDASTEDPGVEEEIVEGRGFRCHRADCSGFREEESLGGRWKTWGEEVVLPGEGRG